MAEEVFTPQAASGPLAQVASTLQVHLDSGPQVHQDLDPQAQLGFALLALPHSDRVQAFARLVQCSM
jgi:hypothetical protein